MRAAVLEAYDEPLSIESVPDPEPDPGGVVIETEACGVCRSDWHAWQGHQSGGDVSPGQILGHEPVGVVVDVGERVETVAEGDRIAVPFSLSDGVCPHCRDGHSNVCPNATALGFGADAQGAFAELVHVPVADQNAVHLPDGVDPAAMAGLGCRFMTAFHALAHRADLAPGDWLAIHGCGGLGLSAVHIGAALGANVVAVDIREEALDKATDLGARVTVNGREEDVRRAVYGATDGGAQVSIDALGIAETCRNSVDCLARRGQHVQLGLTTDEERGEVPLPTDAIALKELDVLGSRGLPVSKYDELFRLVESGSVDPGKLVTREVALSDVSDRLAAMSDFGTLGMEVVTEF